MDLRGNIKAAFCNPMWLLENPFHLWWNWQQRRQTASKSRVLLNLTNPAVISCRCDQRQTCFTWSITGKNVLFVLKHLFSYPLHTWFYLPVFPCGGGGAAIWWNMDPSPLFSVYGLATPAGPIIPPSTSNPPPFPPCLSVVGSTTTGPSFTKLSAGFSL